MSLLVRTLQKLHLVLNLIICLGLLSVFGLMCTQSILPEELFVTDAAGERSTCKIQDGCLDHQKCLHNYVEARRPRLEIVSER